MNEDLSGMKSWNLTALYDTEKKTTQGTRIWKCRCDCGEMTEVSSTNLRLGRIKSCGCLSRGEKHHNYNPSLSEEDRTRERTFPSGLTTRTWSRSVYYRDNYVCQVCAQHGGNLNAHHLNGWDKFKFQRSDVSNGITLCKDCHKEYHHFNGYGGNTVEEFRDHIVTMVGEEYFDEVNSYFNNLEPQLLEECELQTT